MSYAGLADEQGYIRIGGHMVHVEFMRRQPVDAISQATGVPIGELRLRALGIWAPLGLEWGQHASRP